MKRIVVLMLLFNFSFLINKSQAQITKAVVGIDGLTCSQCSKSVEQQMKKRSFVNNLYMALAETELTLTFKEGAVIDWKQIAQAVVDAGFSVRSITVSIPSHFLQESEQQINANGSRFYFLNSLSKKNLADTSVKFQIIGKAFLPRREYRNYLTKYPNLESSMGGYACIWLKNK